MKHSHSHFADRHALSEQTPSDAPHPDSTLSLSAAFLQDKASGDDQEKRTNVLNQNGEDVLSGTSFTALYRLFRSDGMKRGESFFNALYLVSHNRYENSEKTIKKAYRTVHEHPKGWSTDKKKTHGVNIYAAIIKLLDAWVLLRKPFRALSEHTAKRLSRIPHSLDDSRRAAKAFFRVTSKIALPTAAAALVLFTVRSVALENAKPLYLRVYIDGDYVGNTASVADIAATKRQYESDLSTLYGTPVVLQCRITYEAGGGDDGTLISAGDTTIFDDYIKEYTQYGYGLYVDNKLAAVTAVGQYMENAVREYTLRAKQTYMRTYKTDVPESFALGNAITIIAGRYPRSYFLSETELRRLFSLPVHTETETEENADDFAFSYDLNYANLEHYHRAGSDDDYAAVFQNTMPADTSVDVVVTRDETETVTVPYAEETVEDPTMYEGMRRLERAGKDGTKRLHYKVTYSADKILKREVVGEEILRAPESRLVRIGTKEVTDDLRKLLPTGTYIYPYNGMITSLYGWRVMGGVNSFHRGLDIYGPRGSTIVASDGGVVTEASEGHGYGKYVIIQHDEDTYTRYAHCDTLLVQEGDYVGQGDPIATIGKTGNASGYHVHFEVIKNGATVDPLLYLTGSADYHLLNE